MPLPSLLAGSASQPGPLPIACTPVPATRGLQQSSGRAIGLLDTRLLTCVHVERPRSGEGPVLTKMAKARRGGDHTRSPEGRVKRSNRALMRHSGARACGGYGVRPVSLTRTRTFLNYIKNVGDVGELARALGVVSAASARMWQPPTDNEVMESATSAGIHWSMESAALAASSFHPFKSEARGVSVFVVPIVADHKVMLNLWPKEVRAFAKKVGIPNFCL